MNSIPRVEVAPSQIKQELDHLRETVGMLANRVDVIKNRIDPVLRPTQPSPAAPPTPEKVEPMAPLASEIRTISRDIMQLNDVLGEMTERVELP